MGQQRLEKEKGLASGGGLSTTTKEEEREKEGAHRCRNKPVLACRTSDMGCVVYHRHTGTSIGILQRSKTLRIAVRDGGVFVQPQ